jgi:urease accessory protein
MHAHELPAAAGWQARLELGFERRGARSVLVHRSHHGPLTVQKALYPEGDAVCQAIVLHPPGGLCGGDALSLDVAVGTGAHALLTTPGAAKWYRCEGAIASQRLRVQVAAGACMEWLPQENIVFDSARGAMCAEIALSEGARYIGWETFCLGRAAAGEHFDHGRLTLSTRLTRGAQTLWIERGRIDGGSDCLQASPLLAGRSVFGTLIAAADEIAAELPGRLREIAPRQGDGGITLLPGVLIARYLGNASEPAREWFARLWQALRPALLGREAVRPRIWST